MKKVIVKTQFTALHRWKNAPDCVDFLRNYHRHIFYVEVAIEVNGSRQVEFFMFKSHLDNFLLANLQGKHLEDSCEDMAEQILNVFSSGVFGKILSVIVFEDNENGAEVTGE